MIDQGAVTVVKEGADDGRELVLPDLSTLVLVLGCISLCGGVPNLLHSYQYLITRVWIID